MNEKTRTPIDDMVEFLNEASESQSAPHAIIDYEKIVELIKGVRVSDFRDKDTAAEFCKKNGFSPLDFVSILAITSAYIPEMPLITIPKDSTITFGELHDFYEKSRVNFIIIHRVNFIIHQCMIEVYDLLEKENKLRFTAKKFYLKAESSWMEYQEPRRKSTESSAWYTLQDHLRITHDALSPRIEKIYETTRDFMIRMGWRDVELKGRIEVALLILKVHHHSFVAFFKDFKDECGADFSRCFTNDKMDNMGKFFANMCEVLGIKLSKDKYGLYDVAGFDVEKSQRVKWAWDDFIQDLRNDDLMDQTAKQAIELNPSVNENYQKEINEAEQNQIRENMDKLQERFKVTKNKK